MKNLTVIQQEIERQELEKHRAILAFDDRKVDRIDEIITILESLLEPEKEQMITFGISSRYLYKEDNEYEIGVPNLFNEQFKPE